MGVKLNRETKLPHPPVRGTGASVPVPQEEEVRGLLAKGKAKPAVELAKEIHKRCGCPESEALLVDAYAARIRSLWKTGLKEEATSATPARRQGLQTSPFLSELPMGTLRHC
ncbi:MAG: hypothetical protein DMG49_00565 [Acidobacteria bacterium]|nr:MAG: hypothetical protein DMG49_00565 [Acidobacteriota bacterium]